MRKITEKTAALLLFAVLIAAQLTACSRTKVLRRADTEAESIVTERKSAVSANGRTKSADSGTSDFASTEAAETLTNTEEMKQLQKKITRECKRQSGEWAVCVKRTDSGEEFSINNHAMRSASLIKLYIAGTYYEAVQNGTVKDTYGDTVDIMLQQSDNAAANTLIDLLGYETINTFIKSVGASDTTIARKMLEQTTRENYTSVEDCADVLEMVLNGTYVNKSASARILDDLKKQQRTTKIPAGVPSEVETANKTGELTGVENDAAIIWGPDSTYILVVMTDNLPDSSEAKREIVRISEMVYRSLE